MDEIDKALTYIFWLSMALVLIAYYAGSVNLLNAIGANVGGLILTSTGRTNTGTFAAYPTGA
jgi:hypothetical protein